MRAARSIAKNTTFLFIAQMIAYLLSFFYTIYIARYLGAEGFGIISFALALAGIFGIFADLSLGMVTTREVARDKSLAGKYVYNVAIIRLILSAVIVLAIVLIVNVIGYPPEIAYTTYLVALSILITSFASTFSSVFQAYEKMEYLSLGQIINSAAIFLGVLYAISHDFSIIGIAFIYVAGSCVLLAYNFSICLVKFTRPKLGIDTSLWRFLIIQALPITVAGLFGLIAFRVDTIILSALKGNLVVGYYSAAVRILEALIYLPTVYTLAIYPVFSKFHVSSPESLKLYYEKSLKYLIIIGIPLGVGITLLAEKIIFLIYGVEFTQSIIALQILIWAIPFIFLNSVMGSSVISINKQEKTVRLTLITMSLNIILNLILIPYFNYLGAAFVTVLTELTYFVLLYRVLSEFLQKISIRKLILKPVIASAVMGLFLVLVKLDLFLSVLIATAIYVTLIFLFKTFSDDDIELFKTLIKFK